MKKWIALLLVCVMMFALCACSSNDVPAEDPTLNQPAADPSIEGPEGLDPMTPDQGDAAVTPSVGNTMGQTLLQDFLDRVAADPSLSAQALADALITNAVIQFSPGTMPVENGLLMGLGNAEITGFSEGVMFAPAIGSIPFVGYIFVLEDGTDGDAFVQTLKDNADPRWNICVEAEETIVERVDNTVFFLMSPTSMDSAE